MSRTQIFVVAGSLLAAALTGLLGCEGDQGPQGPTAYAPINISASVMVPVPWDETASAFANIANTSDMPQVTINGLEIPRYSTSASYRYDDFPIEYGDSAYLVVNYSQPNGTPAQAYAAIRVPGQFQFLTPDTSQVMQIQYGDSLVVIWSSAAGADAYRIQCYYNLHYYFSGAVVEHQISLNTLLADTSLTLGAQELFPAQVDPDSILYGGGNIQISALNGPWQTGDPGNVTGDGIGFFHGWTYGGQIDIDVVE